MSGRWYADGCELLDEDGAGLGTLLNEHEAKLAAMAVSAWLGDPEREAACARLVPMTPERIARLRVYLARARHGDPRIPLESVCWMLDETLDALVESLRPPAAPGASDKGEGT